MVCILRPLKTARLEERLSYDYCSLSKGMRLRIPSPSGVHELEVLECQPADSIWIVEAQLDLDLEPSEESIKFGHVALAFEGKVRGTVEQDKYALFSFFPDESQRNSDFIISLEAISGDPDLYVDQHHRKPNRYIYAIAQGTERLKLCRRQHTWISADTGNDNVVILASDPRRERGPFWIGVRGHKSAATFDISVQPRRHQ
jgi:hypothetical protein